MLKIVRHNKAPHWTSTTPTPPRITLYATGQALSRVSACLERGRDCGLPNLTLQTLISSRIYIVIAIATKGGQYSFELSGPGLDYSLTSTLQGSHLRDSKDGRLRSQSLPLGGVGLMELGAGVCPVVGSLSPSYYRRIKRLHKSLVTLYLQLQK